MELGDKPLLRQVSLARLSKLMGSVAADARLPVVVPIGE
jgi:hypothetical protein